MSLWTKFVGPRTILGIFLFIIPIFAASLLPAAVDLIVPRSVSQISHYIQDIGTPPKFGAEVAAAYYYVAISASALAVLCVATVCFCFHWIAKAWGRLDAYEQFWARAGAIGAVLLPLTIVAIDHLRAQHVAQGCERMGIDDCVATALFSKTIKAAYNHASGQDHYQLSFMFNWDAGLLAFVVLSVYLLAALTIVLAANMEWLPTKEEALSTEFSSRRYTISVVLFLMAAVLVATMIVVRFRFDVGLATLGSAPTSLKPNPAYAAYQTISSGIMAYWSSVLSIWLALAYAPSAYVLSQRESGSEDFNFDKLFDFNPQGSVFKLLRVAAILSPPVINKIIEIISSAPKIS